MMNLFKKKCKHLNSKVVYISHPSEPYYIKRCKDCKVETRHGDTDQEMRVYSYLIQQVKARIEEYANVYLKKP